MMLRARASSRAWACTPRPWLRLLSTAPQAHTNASADEYRLETSQSSTMTDFGVRRIFTDEHDEFRSTCRKFWSDHVVPHHAAWEEQGHVGREVWKLAGEYGLLGINCPDEYGGVGADILHAAVSWEEQAYALGAPSGPGFSLHSDIVIPYILHMGTASQKRRYLPHLVAGDMISAIAMTEAGAGSDLQGIRTTAVKKADGSGYVLNGSKTYITNGFLSDLVRAPTHHRHTA